MSVKKLSICIPTYNRASLIKEAIESIVNQLDDNTRKLVEITVSDNASVDNTKEVVESFKNNVDIIYHRNDSNIGPDLNYLKCVEIASGEYAWIMGSDDLLPDGSIDYILEQIKSGHSIYLSDRIECDFDLKNQRLRNFTNPLPKQIYDFKDNNDLITYFNCVNTLGGVFSYLTSIVFNKKQWDKIEIDKKYIDSAYMHIYYLFSFMKQEKCTFMHLEKPISICRLGNDGFLDGHNYLKRTYIDLYGYALLADDFFKDKKVKCAFKQIMLREHPFNVIVKDKIPNSVHSEDDWYKFINAISKYPYSGLEKFEIKHFYLLSKLNIIKNNNNPPKYPAWFINTICIFIPKRKNRKRLREKYIK